MLDAQKEKAKLKGENFNVFSVLKMESRENDTHSAFIGELLSPDGSHLQGDTFLKLFLKIIEVSDEWFDVKSASVTLEKYVGEVDIENKTGGRIDIYIADTNGKSISIENKIYAGDQKAQIERYRNHNRENNEVYYLTLQGDDPSPDSKGNLKAGDDYVNISYREHITQWLSLCMKESADQPILRETIKQYLILIRRLTTTMNDEHQTRLTDLIFKNLEAAEYISDNLSLAKQNVCREIHEKVCERLQTKMSEDKSMSEYVIEKYDAKEYVSIKVRVCGYSKESDLHFRIGPFRPKSDEGLFIAVYDEKGNSKYPTLGKYKNDGKWLDTHYLDSYEKQSMCMSSGKTLATLHYDKNFADGFVEHVVTQLKNYITEHDNLAAHLKF